jgi:hypothetical protein
MKKQVLLVSLFGLAGLALGCSKPMMGSKMSTTSPVPPVAELSSPQRT